MSVFFWGAVILIVVCMGAAFCSWLLDYDQQFHAFILLVFSCVLLIGFMLGGIVTINF